MFFFIIFPSFPYLIRTIFPESGLIGPVRSIASDKTGVEMEALIGVTLASLTIYDMLKAVDKKIMISDVKLDYKDGGRSGRFVRD